MTISKGETILPKKEVEQALRALPHTPGVYLFKNKAGTPLYIGKAKNLRVRARAYLKPETLPSPKSRMVLAADTLDHIVVRTEDEALLLENTLIKQHKPKYNVLLKDDKNFRYIRIDWSEDYPRLSTVRRITDSHARYYGPYVSGGTLNRMLRFLTRTFKVRDCSLNLEDTKPNSFIKRPCLKYHLGRCTAPCVQKKYTTDSSNGYTTKEEYREQVEELESFLRGDTAILLTELRERMRELSKEKKYERAAIMRDRIKDIERLIETPRTMVNVPLESADIIGIAKDTHGATAARLVVRKKTLVARETYELSEGTSDPAELMEAFLLQFYSSSTQLPQTILVDVHPHNTAIVETWLSTRAGSLDIPHSQVRIIRPTRGVRRKLTQLAKENAESIRARNSAKQSTTQESLEQLQEVLGLDTLPKRIECVDVSHMQGAIPVASMVVFEDGMPAKDQYRLFNITSDAQDDTRRMQEMLRRRFSHHSTQQTPQTNTKQEEKKEWPLPDLLIVDGGKPQLGVATRVLQETHLETIPLIALAKQEEYIFRPNQPHPVILPHTSPALRLIMAARDEAHRFAISSHRRGRTKKAHQSALDIIPGIGPKTKKQLLDTFGSVQGIKDASDQELEELLGPNKAEILKRYL